MGCKVQDSNVFHAGTIIRNGKTITNGGRVLAVTSYGENHKSALKQSYREIQKLNFEGMYFRGDIGFTYRKEWADESCFLTLQFYQNFVIV